MSPQEATILPFQIHTAQLHGEIGGLAPDHIGFADVFCGGQQRVNPALFFQPAADPTDILKGPERH